MALSMPEILVSLSRAIQQVAEQRGECRVLTLGYPDMLFSKAKLVELFGPDMVSKIAFMKDSQAIWRWHGMQQMVDEPMADAVSFFRVIGATEVLAVDIVASRNVERIVDLNEPLPEDFNDHFDVIIDPGTLEHCFNCGQAMKNIAESLRVGGYIFTAGPLNMYNHGFYSYNPTLYIDFYGQNGFELIDIYGVASDLSIFKLNTTQRFNEAPICSGIGAIVRKDTDLPIKWPVQSKYLNTNHALKA